MLRPKLNRIWTSSNSALRRDPGDAKYLEGWVSEIPTFQVFNYLQYKVDTTMLAIAERGIPEWGSDVSYTNGSLAWDESDKGIYICIVGNPDSSKSPKNNPSQWVKSSIQISRAEYDTITGRINAHIADVKGNPHKLTAGRIGAYNKAEIDALVRQYKALVSDHVNNKNNPHGTKAVDVGAVPVTGGTYTGVVTFSSGNVWLDSGKTKSLSSDNGTSLKNGTTLLYVSDGAAYLTGDSKINYQVITDQTFADYKAKVEKDYAVPDPFFSVDFIDNMNLRYGPGYLINGRGETQYSIYGGIILNNQSKFAISQGEGVLDSNQKTFCAEFWNTDPTNNSADLAFVTFNGTGGYVGFVIQCDGKIKAQSQTSTNGYSSVTTPTPIQTGTWVKVVGVFFEDVYKIFVNGVRVASTTVQAGSLHKTGSLQISMVGRANETLQCRVRNFRVWDIALSDKQVSTL